MRESIIKRSVNVVSRIIRKILNISVIRAILHVQLSSRFFYSSAIKSLNDELTRHIHIIMNRASITIRIHGVPAKSE